MNLVLWLAQTAVAGVFLLAAGSKLAGDPMMVATFEKLGGQWFRYLTGSLEALGAVGLLTPFASGAAALGLFLVMIGAVLAHLVVLGGSATPALVLLVATGAIAWGRRAQLHGLAGCVTGSGACHRTSTDGRACAAEGASS